MLNVYSDDVRRYKFETDIPEVIFFDPMRYRTHDSNNII